MGTISDLVVSLRRLRRARPDKPLHVLTSDFKAAYQSCPVSPEHVQFANILIRCPTTNQVLVTSARHALRGRRCSIRVGPPRRSVHADPPQYLSLPSLTI
eukprot:10807418-Heterocapsa_arctica.AAC.1